MRRAAGIRAGRQATHLTVPYLQIWGDFGLTTSTIKAAFGQVRSGQIRSDQVRPGITERVDDLLLCLGKVPLPWPAGRGIKRAVPI